MHSTKVAATDTLCAHHRVAHCCSAAVSTESQKDTKVHTTCSCAMPSMQLYSLLPAVRCPKKPTHLESKGLVEHWAAAVVVCGGAVALVVIAELDVGVRV